LSSNILKVFSQDNILKQNILTSNFKTKYFNNFKTKYFNEQF